MWTWRSALAKVCSHVCFGGSGGGFSVYFKFVNFPPSCFFEFSQSNVSTAVSYVRSEIFSGTSVFLFVFMALNARMSIYSLLLVSKSDFLARLIVIGTLW